MNYMDYLPKICLELEEFHTILAANHDCTIYTNISFLLSTVLGISLITFVGCYTSLQNEIDSQEKVKKSLMKHIESIEDELTKFHTQAESIKEIEEMQKEAEKIEETEKAEKAEEKEAELEDEVVDGLHED
jgi:sensor domain CHASE-containing protein